MEICSNKHEEICHDCRVCPICNQIESLEMEIEELKERLDTLVEENAEISKENINNIIGKNP